MVSLKEWVGIDKSQKKVFLNNKYYTQKYRCSNDLRIENSLMMDGHGREQKTARDKAGKLIKNQILTHFLGKGTN